jgi:predicted permease
VTRERAAALYRALLTLAPRRIREPHGAEMETLFLERLDDAVPRGRLHQLGVWLAATADVIAAAVREPVRSTRSLPRQPHERHTLMFGSDLRYTLRWLARQRSSSALVVLMLSIGIAANVVVFSLVSGLFLRPFPFPDADRLIYINETAPKWNLEVVGINFPDFHRWQQDTTMFEALALSDSDSFNLSDDRGAERIEGAVVTADFAKALGVEPLLGRMFSAEEDHPKGARVVVIGEAMWRDRFGGSTDVLGRTLRLNSIPHTIVGVMPRAAEFPGRVKLWVPLRGDPNQQGQNYSYAAVGRMKPGVTVEAAEKDLLRAHEAIWNARDKDHIVYPYARALRDEFVRDYAITARTLLGAVALLLVIACANVASVMLARALARRREMGIRLAVGASAARLARQLLLENLIVATVSGVAGLLLGRWAFRLLLAAAGDQVPAWTTFDLDVRVLGFIVLLVVVTALLFGSAPMLHGIRGNLRNAMQDASAATTGGPTGRRTLRVLVAAEFAIAAILLASGGLLLRAYERVRSVDPGFRPDHVLTFLVALPGATYADEAKRLAFWDRLTERLAAAPGAIAAGLVSCAPLGCHNGTFFRIEGRAPLAPGQVNPVTLTRAASPEYFQTLGIRLKAGRFFEPGDFRDKKHGVAIVNETFVRTFWPGIDSPIGRRFSGNDDNAPWMTVVGYVEDVKHYGLEQPMRPGVYFPLAQVPRNTMTVAIRTAGDPSAFVSTARRIVQELDPELPLFRIRTMEEALEQSLANRTLYSWLLAVFAGLAFALALGGSYGVTSYLVSQRTRELGIRVALGARSRDIVRTVLGTSVMVAVIGIVVGAVSSVFAGRLLESLLFGVKPYDPRVLGAVAFLLVGLSALANWIPARRAARADPLAALRSE